MEEIPSIAKWLSGKNILLTGATGYIGKILMEKILRCCPEVKTIYIILRGKKGKSVSERFENLLQSEVWKLMPCDYDFSKIVPIAADLSVSGMGISEEDIKTLQDNVNIVFHGAASIRFTDPFDLAVKSNTRLTYDMIQLARGMKDLQLFVHISTAYVNCNKLGVEIEEELYPAPMDWRKAICLAESADAKHVTAVTPAMLGDFPNTYTFTKNLAEHVVWDHSDKIPVFIYRPVIVISLAREPAPGWTDNISGLEAGYYAIGKGVLRILGFSEELRNNLCPGDITVNAMLVAAWKSSCHSKATGEPAAKIVNSNFINISTKDQYAMGVEALNEQPLSDALWREYFFHITNPTLYLVLHFICDMIPAFIIEYVVLKLTGKDIQLSKGIRTSYVLTTYLMEYFSRNTFNMSYKNLHQAENALSKEDKEMFSLEIFKEGETWKNLVMNTSQRFGKLVNDRQLPLKVRLRQRRIRLVIDKIVRLVLLVFLVVYFPYSYMIRAFSGISLS